MRREIFTPYQHAFSGMVSMYWKITGRHRLMTHKSARPLGMVNTRVSRHLQLVHATCKGEAEKREGSITISMRDARVGKTSTLHRSLDTLILTASFPARRVTLER